MMLTTFLSTDSVSNQSPKTSLTFTRSSNSKNKAQHM